MNDVLCRNCLHLPIICVEDLPDLPRTFLGSHLSVSDTNFGFDSPGSALVPIGVVVMLVYIE
jgi:hypothetical protein